jgi:hypothetical protein
MSDKKISQLTGASTPLAGTEVVPIVQGGSTVKVPVSDLTAGRDIAAAKVTASDNVVIGVAGKGVDFSANTSAAGMTKELLDWYEEGTWTPVLTFATPGNLNVVYSAQVGRYTRIGRLVTVIGAISTSTFTHTTASGNLNVTGLPFAAANVTDLVVNGTISSSGWTRTSEWITPQVSNGSSVVYFQSSASGSALANVTTADTPTATQQVLRFTLTYFV